MINDPRIAGYYEAAAKISKSKLLINWVIRDVVGFAKEQKIPFHDLKVTPEKLAELVDLVQAGTINTRAAKEVFDAVAQTGGSPTEIVKEQGLEQIDDREILERIILEIIENNPKQVEAYRAGKTKLIGFFVGQAMLKTKGRGNPKIIQELLKKHL